VQNGIEPGAIARQVAEGGAQAAGHVQQTATGAGGAGGDGLHDEAVVAGVKMRHPSPGGWDAPPALGQGSVGGFNWLPWLRGHEDMGWDGGVRAAP